MRLVPQLELSDAQVHWVRDDAALGHRGFRLLEVDRATGAVNKLGRLPSTMPERVAGMVGAVYRLLRLGAHNLCRLSSGTILVVMTGRVYRSADGGRTFELVHRLRIGRKPARGGFGAVSGDVVYYGEYTADSSRTQPILLCRSEDDGHTFREVFRFEPGEVRHVHFIQEDPYGSGLWVGTGDIGDECRILLSQDGCRSFEVVGRGSQQWRAVSVVFREDAVIWGTDAGNDVGCEPNFIYRYDRAACKAQVVQEVQGPVHGSCQMPDGTILISTGVEGGENERDDHAHLWASRDGRAWQEIAQWRKDRWPFKVQYGVAHFAHGQESCETLFINLRGLTGHGLSCWMGSIED